MYTGFAAVVFSAGIKAIPAEIMKLTNRWCIRNKIFTSIVVPYIKSSTYMACSKAFDIIYVSTRDLETNLLAVNA